MKNLCIGISSVLIGSAVVALIALLALWMATQGGGFEDYHQLMIEYAKGTILLSGFWSSAGFVLAAITLNS